MLFSVAYLGTVSILRRCFIGMIFPLQRWDGLTTVVSLLRKYLYPREKGLYIETEIGLPFQQLQQDKHSFAGRCFVSPYYKLLVIYTIDLHISVKLVPLLLGQL